jgi:hypothetical protein
MIESVFAPILIAALVITIVLRALYRRASHDVTRERTAHGETSAPVDRYDERRKAS